jgi:hypothetical protein
MALRQGPSAVRSSVGLSVDRRPEPGSDDTGDFVAMLSSGTPNRVASVHKRASTSTITVPSIGLPPVSEMKAPT